jgi:hypothetical protein
LLGLEPAWKKKNGTGEGELRPGDAKEREGKPAGRQRAGWAAAHASRERSR